jgi:cytoskeletal protein RodZ
MSDVTISGSIIQLVIFAVWLIYFVCSFVVIYQRNNREAVRFKIEQNKHNIRMAIGDLQLAQLKRVDTMIETKKENGYEPPQELLQEYSETTSEINKLRDELEKV